MPFAGEVGCNQKIQYVSLMPMTTQPVGNNIFILPDAKEDITPSGIIMLTTTPPNTGKVVAIPENLIVTVAVGDHVGYNPKAGYNVDVDGVTHLAIIEDHIYYKIN